MPTLFLSSQRPRVGKTALAVGLAQRIKDMPKVNDMVQEIVTDAETILRNIPKLLV